MPVLETETKITVDPVLQYNDPRLREVSSPVSSALFGSAELQNWVVRLNAARKHYGGVGIAAPQIGLFQRLVVVEYPEYERVGFGKVEALPLTALVNPQIVWFGETVMKAGEGCLSVRGYEGFVVRPTRIGVVAWTIAGQRYEFEATSLYARVLQHEIDHLDGILYPDRVATLRDIRKIQEVTLDDPVLAHNRLIVRPETVIKM